MNTAAQWEEPGPGLKRRIFEPGQSIMMMEVHFETGAEGYEHSHPHEQFTYCLKGKVDFRIDGISHILVQGETIFVPSDATHGVIALEPSALLDCFTPLREDLLNRG